MGMIMKKLLMFLFVIISTSSALLASDYKIFNDKSGKLTYEVTGARVGVVIVTFDDYGKKMTIESDFSFNGTPNNSISYIEGDTSYVYDNIKKKGYRLPYVERTAFIQKYLGIGDPELTYEDFYTSMGGEIIGKEKINGKKCDIWEIKRKSKKIWLWETYRMKEEYTGHKAFQSIETISEIKLNVEIPLEHFIKPDVPYDMFTGAMKE